MAFEEADKPTHEGLICILMYADDIFLVGDNVDNLRMQVDELGLPAITKVGFAIMKSKNTSVALNRADLRTGLRLGYWQSVSLT